MKLQLGVDPEPYIPAGKKGLFDTLKPAGKQVTSRLDANPYDSVLRRVPSLGGMHRVGWLSGQPSPLSDL
jgi:hypothetical protein